MTKARKKMIWWKKLIIIAVSVLLAAAILFGAVSIYIYESFFGIRYETYMPLGYYTEDFDGLMRANYSFTSDKGQNLSAYLYHTGEGAPKGLIVFAHGFGGGGHNSYMDIINYFAQNGYYVFTYDATGNDESEGKAVGGLPQGVIDLEHALDFVKLREEFYHLPIMLLGHSWGGYSVTNVLKYHPDVKAVASMAGFDTSIDLIKAQGEMIVGKEAMAMALPVMKAYESIKFGEYAKNTAMEAFSVSDASVMVIHSDDDDTVPIQYGYDIWYDTYKDDPRFTFVPLTGQGHNDLLNNDKRKAYTEEFNASFDEYKKTLPEDISKENLAQIKLEYINKNLDRELWCDSVNEELMAEILEFFNNNLK